MAYTYDSQNIFAKILRGEIPNATVRETEHTLAFRDIAPQAPEHILVIPKGEYVTADHFAAAASDAEILDFWRVFGEITREVGVSPDTGNGYRVIANCKAGGGQTVDHLHFHLLGGRSLSWPPG